MPGLRTGGQVGSAGAVADLGRFFLVMGVLLVAIGVFLMVCPKVPGASWIGRLPGDVYIDRPNFRLYVPLGTCLLASLVLTLVLSLFRH